MLGLQKEQHPLAKLKDLHPSFLLYPVTINIHIIQPHIYKNKKLEVLIETHLEVRIVKFEPLCRPRLSSWSSRTIFLSGNQSTLDTPTTNIMIQ